MCIKVYFFERKTMKNDFNSKQFPDIYPGDKGLKIWDFLKNSCEESPVRMAEIIMAVIGTAGIMAGEIVIPQIQRSPPIALPVAAHARSAALRPILGDATAPNVAQPWCPAIVWTAMRTSPRALSFARIAARRSRPDLGAVISCLNT